jgi:hypothetical protein
VLLLIALRRITDVLLTLLPLLRAGVVALEVCAQTGTAIKLCEHYCVAASARRRRRVQNLLHHSLARREDRIVTIRPDPSGDLQRHDQRGSLWKHVGIELSGHFEHGADDGSRAGLHDGRCRALSASLDGHAASDQEKPAFGAVCRGGMKRQSLLAGTPRLFNRPA